MYSGYYPVCYYQNEELKQRITKMEKQMKALWGKLNRNNKMNKANKQDREPAMPLFNPFKVDETQKDKNVIILDIENPFKTDNKKTPYDTAIKGEPTQKITPLTAMLSMLMLGQKNMANKPQNLINSDDKPDNKPEEKTEDNTLEYELIEDKIGNIQELLKFAIKMKNTEKNPNKRYPLNIEALERLIEPLEKINSLIGLNEIKDSVLNMIIYYLQNFEKENKNLLHTVITGMPGVGKTEFGRILGEIYCALGVIPTNKFTLVKRTDLIGEYLGHTAHKTQNIIDEADGGVLFIDEAYGLGSEDKKDTYSKECIDVINQNLTEKRKKLIVIIAGYENELEKSFFSYNPGLRRRFPFKYNIAGYTPDELGEIFKLKVKNEEWEINIADNNTYISEFFNKRKGDFPHYGGDIENLFTMCKFIHSRRVFGLHPSNRKKITVDDLTNGFDEMLKYRKNKSGETSWKNMYV